MRFIFAILTLLTFIPSSWAEVTACWDTAPTCPGNTCTCSAGCGLSNDELNIPQGASTTQFNNQTYYCVPCDSGKYGANCAKNCSDIQYTDGQFTESHRHKNPNNQYQVIRGAQTEYECYKDVSCIKPDLTTNTNCRQYNRQRDPNGTTPEDPNVRPFFSCKRSDGTFFSGTDDNGGAYTPASLYLQSGLGLCIDGSENNCAYHGDLLNGVSGLQCATNKLEVNTVFRNKISEENVQWLKCTTDGVDGTAEEYIYYTFDASNPIGWGDGVTCYYLLVSEYLVPEKKCTIHQDKIFKKYISISNFGEYSTIQDYYDAIDWGLHTSTYYCKNCSELGYLSKVRTDSVDQATIDDYGYCYDNEVSSNQVWCSCVPVPQGYYHAAQTPCDSWATCNPFDNKTPCFAGMTTSSAGSTRKEQCHYTSDTQFCDAYGCFKFNSLTQRTSRNNATDPAGVDAYKMYDSENQLLWIFPNSYR